MSPAMQPGSRVDAIWAQVPGIGALLSSIGDALAMSPGWRACMQVPQWNGDWRNGLDQDSRLHLLQVLARARDFNIPLQLWRPGEDTTHYRCTGWWDPLHRAHGCYLIDVTVQEAERQQHETLNGWIRQLFEQLPVQLAYFTPPPEARCLFANSRYARAMGHDENSILGRSVVELLTPDELDHLREAGRNHAQEGKDLSFLHSRRRPEGDEVLEVSLAADRWPDGRLRGTFVLMTDVTERHRAEMALRTSRERLSRFLEASAEGVIFHRDGTITDANPAACRLSGHSHAELVGRTVASMTPRRHRDRSRVAIGSGADAYFESEIHHANGEAIPVELIGRTMEIKGERLRMTVIRDIRDRRQAQARIHTLIEDLRSQKDRAEAADRAKSVFLAAASHDLRQPIHALGLFLTALRAMAQAPSIPHAELAQICRRMQASLDGLGQLLNMLLDVSRLDANAVQVELAPHPLAQLFIELDQEFADLAHEKGLHLHVASSSAWGRTDATVLRRILSNLMSNAIRYTQRGRVLLGVRSRGDRVEIQVWDQGIGIAPGQLEAIFEEFYQIDPARTRRNESHGLGLGLSIVKRSARLIGAPLRVHSAPGQGSMFSITVPRATAPSEQARPARAEDLATTAALAPGARRVLVIDDEEQVLMGMQQLLQVWGHQVWCANSADEAVVLAIAHAHEIDLLLSDYRLGGNMTAVQAIAAVHACLPAPVPTYILTGDTSPQRIQEASELGFPLLHKPVDPNALRVVLER
ncbi:hypothetical protein Q5W_18800 [Hydrogenophaga sp. PBC]|uniref:PAS domain-containing hybrid sensor histidine kinase/response regulator n=1 Tax=Hydrogenophaga sp. PBC TaxID=795665 RepID=UPI000854285F|nr:PAS domain S-box protein [Hydrogenophaga sp. PBC]AOS80867.1 hypothetical protein Q5W_18800 [Hydrogenophaga sp. PBC]